jgi:hypothetical protein
MFLSLGPSCTIRHQLQATGRHTGPTHFFDWLVSENHAILHVLRTGKLQPIKLRTQQLQHGKKMSRIQLHPGLISLHDVGPEIQPGDLERLVETYTRRRNRLLDAIRTQPCVVFIRKAFLGQDFVLQFFNELERIAPGNQHVLVSLITGFPRPSLHPRFREMDLRPYTHDGPKTWMEEHVDWSTLFQDIHSNYGFGPRLVRFPLTNDFARSSF